MMNLGLGEAGILGILALAVVLLIDIEAQNDRFTGRTSQHAVLDV